jgi:hypothetical protein
MLTRNTVAAALLAGAITVGCQEAATAPRKTGTPRFATAADTGGGGKSQFHFVSNGDGASANWASGDSSGSGGGSSFITGFLQVTRGGPTNNPQTFLSYQVEQTVCDPLFNCTFTLLQGGFGTIPNGDFSGGGKQLRLRTNTSNNPNFIVFAGNGGLVSVTWQANGFFFSSSSGTSTFKSGTFSERFQGTSSNASATATGSIVGIPIDANQSSGIGSNHTVQIDIFR